MATLKDVAKLAGVSPSLVSYVINDKKTVKPETQKRIDDAIKELDFKPNLTAKSLKTSNSSTIGVIVPDLTNIFFIDVIRGMEGRANQLGYNVVLCNTNNDSEREKKYIDTLLSKNIDGMVLIANTDRMQSSFNYSIPIVVIDRHLSDDFYSVSTDNMIGGYLATEHLIKKGYQKIAIVKTDKKISTFYDRWAGYKKAHDIYDLKCDSKLAFNTGFTHEDGYKIGKTIIESKLDIDAIFACNDYVAIGIIRAMVEEGFKIPQDIAIVGFDDIPISKLFIPALTTVAQPKFEIGKKATEMLVDLINKRPIEINHVIFQPTLKIRETT